jgi:hypothetical protein
MAFEQHMAGDKGSLLDMPQMELHRYLLVTYGLTIDQSD